MEYKFNNVEHVHLLGDKPLCGTSTVVGILSKPLTWWASGLAVEKFGWINKGNAKKGWTPKSKRLSSAQQGLNKIKSITDVEDYLSLLDEAYAAHSKKLDSSATAGTDMHAELERYVLSKMTGQPSMPFPELIQPFIEWADKNVKRFMISEGNVFSERMWTGGITDVMFEHVDGRICIGDFKSSKEAYISQFIQAAGYDLQQEENGVFSSVGTKLQDPVKVNAYYIFTFGDGFNVTLREDTEALKKGFEACVLLYKLNNL